MHRAHSFTEIASMAPRALLLTAGLLCIALAASPAFPNTNLHAQGPRFGLSRDLPAWPGAAGPQSGLFRMPDSVRRYPPTHGKTGLLIGGVLGGALGAALGGGLCGYSDISGNCTGAAIGGALMFGASAGAVGALIGGLFPREPKRPEPPMATPAGG